MDHATTPTVPQSEALLSIGNRTLPSRYFLAPLAGYTQLPFRRAVRELGGMGLATTDLVHATALVCGGRKSLELVATSPDDRPLSVQIFGGVSSPLVEAAQWLEARGYGGVDINMGCPMAKVNGQGGGARLMCDVDGAVRTGEQVGVAAVTVHGRTREQGFQGNVQLDAIRATVEAVERIPVIGNGDVRTVDDALRMREVTGCAAVAIGRGVLLDPWIFRKLERAELGAATSWEPTVDDQVQFLSRNFELMWEHHDHYACVLFRKFAGWYGA